MDSVIPTMEHPLSIHWTQPALEDVLVDDHFALMTKATLNKLHIYNCSQPSGCYEGKMWARCFKDNWYLYWFGKSDDPDMCSNNCRPILLVG